MTVDFDNNSFYLQGGRTGVLLFHGFTATTFEVKALADFLNSEGFTVSAPLLPGHGTKPEDLNHVKMQEWLQTAEEAYQNIKKNCDQVFVGGESMGALLCLDLAQKHAEIPGLLVYAPALINPKLALAPLLRHFMKFSRKRNSEDIFEWQGYQVNPVAGAAELFFLQNKVTSGLKKISQPIIIFQGRNDHTVLPSGASHLYNSISSIDKELVWYDCGHCVLLEESFQDAVVRTLGFIKRIMAS